MFRVVFIKGNISIQHVYTSYLNKLQKYILKYSNYNLQSKILDICSAKHLKKNQSKIKNPGSRSRA